MLSCIQTCTYFMCKHENETRCKNENSEHALICICELCVVSTFFLIGSHLWHLLQKKIRSALRDRSSEGISSFMRPQRKLFNRSVWCKTLRLFLFRSHDKKKHLSTIPVIALNLETSSLFSDIFGVNHSIVLQIN